MAILAGSGASAYIAMWKTQLRRDVALLKAAPERTSAVSSKKRKAIPKRGSKVQDEEEAPEAKRFRLSSSARTRSSAQEEVVELTETKSDPAIEEVENNSNSVASPMERGKEEKSSTTTTTSGRRRRRVQTDRFQPS